MVLGQRDIESIKDILLEEDRYLFQKRIDVLESELSQSKKALQETREMLQSEVSQLKIDFNKRISELATNQESPDRFNVKLVDSKGQLIDVLGPQMGKLIRKSVASQVEQLNKRLQESTSQFLRIFNFKRHIDRLMGKTQIHQLNHPQIAQLLIIEKESGLLLGKYERKELVQADADALAGMFTAIKSFAESAINSDQAELDLIDYGDYSIKLMNYGTYYYSIIFSGRYTPDFEKILVEGIDAFADKHIKELRDYGDQEQSIEANEKIIKPYFDKLCQRLERKLSY